MSTDPVPGDRIGERFTIEKVLVPPSETEGAMYVVRDSTDNQVKLVQLIPVASKVSDELSNRQVRFDNAIGRVQQQVNHPQLVGITDSFRIGDRQFVVLQNVTGVPLMEAVAQADINQVVQWAIQLCDALAYLENRPMPVVLDVLDSNLIFVNPNQEIKLLNYRLHRLYSPGTVPFFSSTRADRDLVYVALGNLLNQMLNALPQQVPIPLSEIVRLCLNQSKSRAFANFGQVEAGLVDFLNRSVEGTSEDELSEVVSLRYLLRRVMNRVLSQPRTLLILEVLVLFVWAPMRSGVFTPRPYEGPISPTVYVAAGIHDLFVMSPLTRRIAWRQRLENLTLQNMSATPDGQHLILWGNKQLDVYSTRTRQVEATEIYPPRQQPPREVVASDDGHFMYCAYDKESYISEYVFKPTFHEIRRLPVEEPPGGLAIAHNGRYLYVSQKEVSAVDLLDLQSGKFIDEYPLAAVPGPLAVSPDDKRLWVASADTNSVFALNVGSPQSAAAEPAGKVVLSVWEIQGRHPTKLRYTPDGQRVYVLCQDSNSISVLRASDGQVITTISSGGSCPLDWAWISDAELWVINYWTSNMAIINCATDRFVDLRLLEHQPKVLQYTK